MKLQLDGARVVITAAASGIGLAIAKAYVDEGADVQICDIDDEALDTVRADYPRIGVTRCDVTDPDAVDDFLGAALERLGGLDVLVNNAGIAGPTARIEDVTPDEWHRCIATCLGSQYNCIRRSIPHLRLSRNASIVNLSSAAGRMGFALRTPYAAAKWGVVGLSKSLAVELGPDRIRVNAVLPGIVAGERQRLVLETKAQRRGVSFETIEEEAFAYASLKEYVTATQIADQILFMTSELGRTITGQAISICGDLKMLT